MFNSISHGREPIFDHVELNDSLLIEDDKIKTEDNLISNNKSDSEYNKRLKKQFLETIKDIDNDINNFENKPRSQ